MAVAVPVSVEVAAIHEPHIGGLVERHLNHFVAIKYAEIVVEVLHGAPLRVPFGRVGTPAPVSICDVASGNGTPEVTAAGTLGARRFVDSGVRTCLAMLGSNVAAADHAAVASTAFTFTHHSLHGLNDRAMLI